MSLPPGDFLRKKSETKVHGLTIIAVAAMLCYATLEL